jgi:uncharacterized protein (DUF2267 family)
VLVHAVRPRDGSTVMAADQAPRDVRCSDVKWVTPGTAGGAAGRWDASAVLSRLADAISSGELNQLLSQLPSGYATLFGRPGLS